MLGRRTVHAFALVTTLIAAQLAVRSVVAHVHLQADAHASEVAASR